MFKFISHDSWCTQLERAEGIQYFFLMKQKVYNMDAYVKRQWIKSVGQ